MPDFDKDLNPILLNEDSNPLNLPNPSTPTPNYYRNLGGGGGGNSNGSTSGKQSSMVDQFFGSGPVVSPMLPTVSAKELYDNRRYGKYNANIVDIEDQKAYAQSNWDKAANGILKGVNLAATTVAGGFGLLYGSAKAMLPGGKLSDIWDNEATRALDEYNNEVDQTYLPNYYTNAEKNAAWYSTDNWFTTNWLFDKLIKNSGYAVGAMLSGNIANGALLRAGSLLGKGLAAGATAAESSQAFKLFTPLLRNTARAFSVGKNIEAASVLEKQISSIADITSRSSKLGELAKQTNAFAKFGDVSRRGIVAAYSSAGEASFEALQTANQFRDNLIEKYKETHGGEEPMGEELEKINQTAESVGKTSFFGNLALLGVTEYVQLPKILGSNYNASKQAANSLMGRVDDVLLKDSKYMAAPTSTTKFGKLYDKVTGVGKYVFDPKEAGQEIGQYALQVGTQNYFNKAYQTDNASMWIDGFLYGFVGKDERGEGVGAFVSKEGIESGILGGITGGLMQARGNYLETKTRRSNTQIFADELTGAPSFKKAFIERKNAINRGIILQQQEQEAVINGDELEAKDLAYDYMHNYLSPRVKYGRYDMVKDDIREMREQSATEKGFAELKKDGLANISDERETFLERLNEFERTASYVNELYRSLNLRYSGVLDAEGKRKYSDDVIDKMVYAASKIANYDVRIPADNARLTSAGINTLDILESIIQEFNPNKAATEQAINDINKMNVISEEKDQLKTSLSRVIEMSLRRKLFMDEYDAIKNKPEDFEIAPEFAYGETEELPVNVKQIGVPEGKKRKKELEKQLEVGKTYSLEQPFIRKGNNLTIGPKIKVMSQTLGGEFEVMMPDGQIRFITPEDFKNYTVSEFDPVTPKLNEIFDNAIDSVLKRKKYDALDKPIENRLEYINSLNNKELIDDVEKEFNKRAAQYLKDLKDERLRSEAMKKHSAQIQKDQEEIEKGSAEPPTGPDDYDESMSGNWEDMKKAASRLFPSTTTISEDWEAGNIPAHVTNFIQFTNNAKNIRKRFDLRVMLVTSAQQKLLGLDGLAEMSFGSKADKSTIVTKEQYDKLSDDAKKDVSENGFIGAVVIKVDNKGNKFFIDKDGNSIGKVGEVDAATGQVKNIELGKVVFSTMPTPGLYNSKKQPKYRNAEKEEAEQYSEAWREYRKNLFANDPNQFLEFDFGVSKGISVKKEGALERNFVDEVLMDNPKRMETEQFLQISTKGEIAHDDGNNYKVPLGRPVYRNADDLAYLNNNKFSEKRAKTIFAALKELSNRANRQIENGINVNINYPELTDFLRDVLFWYTKSSTTPSANKLYIDSNNMLRIGRTEEGKVVESVYDFANIGKFESEVINDLMNSYHNVNHKTLSIGLGKTFTELYLDDKNVLQKRVWPNYQMFLISSTYPDGTKRTIDDTPLFTRIAKPTASVPYPFKQKYLFLLGINLPKTSEKKEGKEKKPKEEVEQKEEYVFDGKTVNKYNRKDFIDLGGVYEFTAENVTSVETLPTEANNKLIEKINKDNALKNKMREIILDIKKVDGTSVFKKESVDALGNDIDFVEAALPVVIGAHLNRLQKAAAEKPTEAPAVTPPTPPAPTPPPPSSIDLSGLNEELPFRAVGKVGKEVERMSDAEIEYFKEFVKKNLPGIPYEFIENLVRMNGADEQAWGVFENGVAKIYKRAAKGTAFHEIMEGVWLGFLSPNEQTALLDEMRSKKGTFLDRASGRRIEYSEATNLQLKERIMDDFAEYMDGKIPAKTVTQRILQFFKAIVEFFKRWMGNPSLKEKLFIDIRRGKYKKMIFSEEKKKYPAQYKEIEGLSEKQVNDFVQDMSARLFIEIFKNNESFFDIVNTVNKLDIFNIIKEKYRSAGVFNTISEEAYSQLVTRTKDFLTKFSIEFDEDNAVSENDVNRTKDGYAADTFSVNVKKSSPYAVKLLLASLTRMKKESGPMNVLSKMPSFDTSYSSLQGGLSLVPFSSTFSALINKLSNVRDVPTFVNKLYELATENPDYVYLYRLLGGDMSASSPRINFKNYKAHNWRLFVSFYQVFTKQKPEGFIQFIDDKEVYTGSANQASLVKQIAEEWKENMKLLSEDESSIVKFDFQKGVYKVDKSSDKWKNANISSPQGMIAFLSDIGIDFPLEAYNRIKSSDLKKFADAVSGIKTSLNKSDVLMTVKAKDFDMRGHVESLSSLFVSSTNPAEDSTFFNNKGERQQSFTESNYLSYFEYAINSVESLTELKELMPQLNDVFSTNSIFLKPGGVLFDEEGYRRKNTPIKVQYVLGDKNKKTNTGKSVSDLTIGKRTTLEINQNIRGSYYVIVGGDSKTEWMVNLGNQITLDQITKGEAYEKINTIFYDYLKDEVYLARDADQRKGIKNIGKKAGELRFFKGIFSEKLIDDVTKELIQKDNVTDNDISEFIETNKERIDGDIKSTIEQIAKKQEDILKQNNEITAINREGVFRYNGLDKSVKSLGINKFDLTEKNINDLMTFVTVNHIISQIEYHKILFGDPYQFKVKYDEKGKKVILDETKRIKSFESPRKITVSFPELNNWMNDELNTIDGEISLTKDDVGFHLHKEFAKTFTMRDSIVFSPLATKFEPYEKVDQADASSWMSAGAHREVKFKNGQWPPEAEDFYQWEMAYARKKLNEKGKYSYPKGERGKRLLEHDENLLKNRPVKYFIEVLKPVATGSKYADNKINLLLDKTSQVPLFYRAVEGTNLEELFMKFFKEGFDYSIVESGRKVGIENVYDFYNADGTVNTAPIGKSIDVPWEAYGIQVENSYGKPKLQTRGSQLTKLATVDLYSNGESIGDTPERKNVISNAIDRNRRVLDELTKNGYKSLLKKLSIVDLGSSFEVTDKKKLHDLLKRELLNVSMSDNTIDSIGIDPTTGEFEIPFEASVNYKRIKDVLYSIVDKSISSPKMNGFSAVQVSAAMWENSQKGMGLVYMTKDNSGNITYKKISRDEYNAMDDEKKKNVRVTNDTLKFYEDEDGKRHCEIMIPNWFRRKLGRDMSKEEFTEFANTEEGRKALTGIGFRIPTQALNSVEVFVVKGFLPDFMGRTVVVPSEITTKAGSDFDIDKLNLYLKNIYVTPLGEIKEVPFFGFGEDAKKRMADFIFEQDIKAVLNLEEDITGEPKEDDYDTMAEMLYKESLENEYYDSLVELLTLPENFNRLVAPNTSKPLEDIAEELSSFRNEIEEVNPMRTMIDRTKLTDLRHTFIMAKNWVGRVATNITAHSLFQKTQMYVKPSNFKMSLPHNTITIGNNDHISFSSLKDVKGERYISDVLSMFTNSFVDVVKDPYIMKIIYSDRLVSTFMMLTRAGVPIDTISYFMNQPIIREYVKKLDADGVSPFTLYSERTSFSIMRAFPANEGAIKKGMLNTTNDSLKNNIKKFYSGEKLTPAENVQQQLALREFMSYFDLSNNLFGITTAINYDTTNFRNADDIIRKHVLADIAKEENKICCPSRIMESSFMGELQNALDKSSFALGTILKFNTPEFRSIIDDVMYEYMENIYLSKDKFNKIAEKMSASFLDYIIQVRYPLAIKDLVVDANSVANRVEEARKKHPEVTILKDLILVSSDTPGGAKTLKLRVNTKDAYDEDLYVGYMREMRNNPATRDLYEDVVKLGIIQGTYYSSVSIKNIIPVEDYARIVAPIMSTLEINDDILAFKKNKMFQRNLFKDETIVAKVTPKFYITENEEESPEDYIIGFDSDEIEVYQYSTKAFPEIPSLGVVSDKNGPQRTIFKLKPSMKGATHSVITIPRILNIGGERVDFVTGRTVTNAFYSERKAKGDRTIYDIYGYKRVEELDGTPFLTEDGHYVYKQINLVGDGQLATEYSVFPKKSVINNNTVKVEMEIPDEEIIRHFVEQVPVQQSEPYEYKNQRIPFNESNLTKILTGKKTSTLRSDMEAADIGIPVGKTEKILIEGKEFNVTNRGKMSVEQAGGAEAIAKSEGLPTTPDENNKYEIDVNGVKYYTMFTSVASWLKGIGENFYVYNIQPVSPAQQEAPKEEEVPPPLAPIVSVPSVKKVGEPIDKKDFTNEIKNIILTNNLEIYKVVEINGEQKIIDLSYVPSKINSNSTKFYTTPSANFYIERYGKPIVVPGFEDVNLMIEQNTKSVFELSTGRWITVTSKTEEAIKQELKEMFEKINVKEAINKHKKIDINKELIDVKVSPTETSPSLVTETGRYVQYKGETYIVTKKNDNNTVQIYNPTKEGPSAKISVSPSNLTALESKAKIVTYKSEEYIVTPKKSIISLKTNKLMKWGDENGDRKAILQVASVNMAKILTFENAFSEERRKQILNNFAVKHKMTQEGALDNIRKGIAKEGQKAIDKLNECY
jgi:hypothetical protein